MTKKSKHGESYLNIRIEARMGVKARTKEEALEKVKKRIEEEMRAEYYEESKRQGATGFFLAYEDWLRSVDEKMVGVEIKEGKVDGEYMRARWSNIKRRKRTKGGVVDLKRKKRGVQTRLK